MTGSTLLLTRSDVRKLLTLDDCIETVGRAFARQAAREDPPAALLSVHVPGGGFHAKAAVLDGYFATLLSAARLVVDNLEQSATIGELHHALERGLATRELVHAELGELIAGTRTGRLSRDEIMIFDSTGTAVQDVAAAAVVYERSRQQGAAARLDLAS